MKKIFIGIFMLSIVGLFAATHFNTSKNEGDPGKKQTTTKTELNKSEKAALLSCAEEVQNGIANCYGIDPSYVCCVTPGGNYSLLSPYTFYGTFTWSSCGSGCSIICLIPYGIGTTPCCFHINYDWPSGC